MNESHQDLLMSWRVDEFTIETSTHRNEITQEEHAAWMMARLYTPNQKVFMYLEDGVYVGTCTLIVRGDKTCEISGTVSPEFRKQGVGTRAVTFALLYIPEGWSVTARLRTMNTASRKILIANGFREYDQKDDYEFWSRECK